MERLSPLDASFLSLETPSAHMHVGWLSVLELPDGADALDVVSLRERIAGRLRLAPRFRQRVLSAPLGEPFLSDDPEFRIEDHVRVAGGDHGAVSDDELHELADALLSQPLDRARPLWEIHVVPRLRGGRAALLGKVHHALVDGVAAVELGTLLFDLAPNAAPADTDDWAPEPAVSPTRVTLSSVADTALEQFRTAGRLAALGLRPRRTMRVAESMRRAAFNLAEQVGRPAPTSYLNRNLHPDRTLLTRSVPFGQLDRLKARLRVRLNDVVLAIAAGVLRRHAALCEEELVPLRAMVPVNVRGDDDAGAGNRIVFGFVELPLPERDPVARVDQIRSQTRRLKHSEHLSGSEALIASIGQLPSPIKVRAARIAAGPRVFNLTISNVPGPRMPLYVAGARATSIYPVIPLSDGHALAMGVLSYADQLHFALHADPRSIDDSSELPGLIDASISELEAAARSRHPPPRAGVRDSSDQVERRSDSGPVRSHRDRDRVEQRHRPERGPGAGAGARPRGARLPQHRQG